ncbi:hypothetical protein AVEN_66113-1 [Araneus ventricosus]|uniref:Uncharacterized protein n=1 Tax=Araneus ventricosus TaxID=182803 RepID=A0A4Y2G271_ARAVE|nr:hypothetical protein AVEN_66113-1 [Araneus ventricosus]
MARLQGRNLQSPSSNFRLTPTTEGRLSLDVRFNVPEDPIYGDSSAEAGFESGNLRFRILDLMPLSHRLKSFQIAATGVPFIIPLY